MAQLPSTPNPREAVQSFRKSYTNLHALWSAPGKKVPKGVTLRSPTQSPIRESDLPEGARSLLAEYRKVHAGLKTTLVKYMRMVNGVPVMVIEDATDLPPDDKLLSLSQTATLIAQDSVQVVMEIVVARKD